MPISRPAFVSRHKKPPLEATHQQVYSADYSVIHEVPLRDVHHLSHRATRLVLCSAYMPDDPTSCPAGSRCKAVHCDISNATRSGIHVNYAYPNTDAVNYKRLPAGDTLFIAAPNDVQTMDVIASELVLQTRALDASRRPLSHCAHYYFNRTCNLGAECQFIHAVYVDCNARHGQRAPLPSQMGRSYRPEDSRKNRSQRLERETSSPVGSDSFSNSLPSTEGVDLSSATSSHDIDILPSKSQPLQPVLSYCFNPYSQESAYLVLPE